MITLSQINKQFTQGERLVTALQDVSLHVAKGEIFGVIGASGAGKSTLIRCVNLLERPTTGQVVVDGVDLLSLSDKQLAVARQQIGMIFQHFNLLASQTVFDNVALPLTLKGTPKAQIQQRVSELLTLVGLADKQHSYPAHLSGGQKQRVAIARALAPNPKVLLCDEATSALDPATTQAILLLLKDINQRLGITILLITHEMEVVKRICDKVAVIDQGHLVEQGNISDIFSHPQTELARQFIQSTLHLTVPDEYQQRLQPNPADGLAPLWYLEFTGRSVDAPVISQAARQFDMDMNILSSQIDYAGGVKFGVLLVEVKGNADNIAQTAQFLQQHHVNVKVLGYV